MLMLAVGRNGEAGEAGDESRADVLITNGTILAGGPVEFLHIYGEGTTVRVQQAYFESRYFVLDAPGAGSTLVVDGDGATVHFWGYNNVGVNNRASIIVTNGGTVKFDSNITLGQTASGYGRLIVSGPGSSFACGPNSGIGGSGTAKGGTGDVVVRDGGTSSNQHDHLIVHDTLTCAGVLDVRFIDGFAPSDGDTFDILAGAPIAGQFKQVVLHDPAYGSLATNDLYTIGRIGYEALSVMPPPTKVAASDGAYETQVSVTWTPVGPATGYEVWRNASNDTGTATQIGTTAGTAFDDTTASASVTNWYWVKATNPAHQSDFSLPDTGWMAPVPPYEIQWANPSGGDFHAPGNWEPPYIPTAGNQAVFNITSAPYTVTWSGPATNAAFKADQGTVTFDFGGHEYRLNVLAGQSTIGTPTTTADVTLTNGRLWVEGQNASNKLFLRGDGSILRILEAEAMNLAYPYLSAGTTVIVDGTNALCDTLGYSYFYGNVVVTNGAKIDAAAGTPMYGNATLHIAGGDHRHEVAFSTFAPQSEVRFSGGIEVRNNYVNTAHRTPAEGRLVLDGATFSEYYTYPTYFAIVHALTSLKPGAPRAHSAQRNRLPFFSYLRFGGGGVNCFLC